MSEKCNCASGLRAQVACVIELCTARCLWAEAFCLACCVVEIVSD
jgi:NADH:ubiquinone oxidoreductase subunit B-like Fe-S oxidoreductase